MSSIEIDFLYKYNKNQERENKGTKNSYEYTHCIRSLPNVNNLTIIITITLATTICILLICIYFTEGKIA